MGYALATGLVKQGTYSITVADPEPSQLARFTDSSIRTVNNNAEAIVSADIVVLCVKPQMMATVAADIATVSNLQIVISIAAGIRLSRLVSWFPDAAVVIRAMPNTPSLVGHGMIGLCTDRELSTETKDLVENLFASVGETAWFESDEAIDAVTAISGSGPAYFYYFIEAIVSAASPLRLPKTQATNLAVRTLIGAGKMLEDSTLDPTELRRQVTSPGGTTEAAIQTMEDLEVSKRIHKGVVAAYHKAQELAL